MRYCLIFLSQEASKLTQLEDLDFPFYLSEAVPLSQPRGEQTKILKFEFAPIASSTMYANTLRPRILVLTSFVWS